MITGALTGVSPRVFVFHSPRNFRCAETPALSSILGTVEVPPEPFLSKLLTRPQTISLFAPPNTHVKPRRQIVLPHFTDESRGLKEIEQVAQSDPASVQWRQLCSSGLSLLGGVLSGEPPAFLCIRTAPGSCYSPDAPGQPWGFRNSVHLFHSGDSANRPSPRSLKLACCCGVLNLR